MFLLTLVTVGVMLLYAVPGYLTVKTSLIKPDAIPAFAKLLMYVCQPCLTVYSFQKCDYTPELGKNILIFFLLSLVLMGAVMAVFYLIFRKKQDDARCRIVILSACFGNVTFMGVPLVEALLPQYSEALIYSTVFFIAMNILGWTVGSTLITRDKSYCKPMKILMNPAVLALVVALPLFFLGIKLPGQLGDGVTLLGKMSTPLCMLILGMRLATVPFSGVFTDKLQYVGVAAKQLIMPLLALALASALPIPQEMRLCFYILAGTPVAAVVLTFAEMLGEGQKEAANSVLLSTLLSIISLPLLLLLA